MSGDHRLHFWLPDGLWSVEPFVGLHAVVAKSHAITGTKKRSPTPCVETRNELQCNIQKVHATHVFSDLAYRKEL